MQSDYSMLVACFAIWTGLGLLLLRKRKWQITFRTALVLITGYAVLAGLASPRGNAWLRSVLEYERAAPLLLIASVVMAIFILRVSES